MEAAGCESGLKHSPFPYVSYTVKFETFPPPDASSNLRCMILVTPFFRVTQ